jgi:hypothetical protein
LYLSNGFSPFIEDSRSFRPLSKYCFMPVGVT